MEKTILGLIALLIISTTAFPQEMTGKEIVEKADQLQRGETNEGEMSMTIIRPKWERTITMKNWSKGQNIQ